MRKKEQLKQVLPFDPYIISGYDPSENQLSDGLKGILDPNGIHGLASEGLRALLDAVNEVAEPKIKKKVDDIESALKDPSAVWVHRERSVEGGRIDIRISDGKTFLIFVENKKGHNPSEVGETPQTVRYQEMLDKAEDAGLIGLGIYLTPDGTPAKSKDFVAVSCGDFAGCLRARLSRQDLHISEDTRTLLSAFALTYAWMN